MPHDQYQVMQFESANELWEALSPTKEIVPPPCKLLFRGQANADWGLIPLVLRKGASNPSDVIWGDGVTAEMQIFSEVRLLEIFAEFCDEIGVRIPGDSINFRNNVLSHQVQDKYFINPSLWPNPHLIEIMALAQHHGVPTRLLDWTTKPYVAAYFAASSALSNMLRWEDGEKLALWILNTEQINLYPKIQVVRVPASISPHLSAQSGLFTVHPHNGARGELFDVKGLEEEFSILANTPLTKVTLPVTESFRLLELCQKAGFTGAKIYPSADGAGKAVMDSINMWAFENEKRK